MGDIAGERGEFDREAVFGLANDFSLMRNCHDAVGEREFQRDVRLLVDAEHSVVAGEKDAADAPILHGEGFAVDDAHALIHSAARMASLIALVIIADAGAHAGQDLRERGHVNPR